MSFFIPDRKKRTRPAKAASAPGSNKKAKRREEADEINSDEIASDEDMVNGGNSSDEEAENTETADEKRIRFAKRYLERIKRAQADSDESDRDDEAVEQQIREDTWEASAGGKRAFRKVADLIADADFTTLKVQKHKSQQLSVTSVRISEDDKYVYASSKDGSVESGQRLTTYKGGRNKPELGGHTAQILTLALSSDGKLLASGGMDKVINIWDTEKDEKIHTFKQFGHKDSVTGLAFRVGTRDLFSAGADRSVKIWNCTDMIYVQALYGHKANINCLDALTRETCVTVAADKTIALWNIVEENCLVFRGPKFSLDSVAMINEEHFVCGGQDGNIYVYSAAKRNPVTTIQRAHSSPDDTNPNWITSLASLRYSDLIASGSWNGELKLWRVEGGYRGLTQVASIPLPGYINSLHFSRSGKYLVAGIGQEHRFGRWARIPEAKNGICIIPLPTAAK